MIFLDNNNNKIALLFILLSFFIVIIFWAWTKTEPIKNAGTQSDDQFWSEIANRSQETFDGIGNDLEFTQAELANTQNDLEIATNQQALWEAAQEYIADKASSSEEEL